VQVPRDRALMQARRCRARPWRETLLRPLFRTGVARFSTVVPARVTAFLPKRPRSRPRPPMHLLWSGSSGFHRVASQLTHLRSGRSRASAEETLPTHARRAGRCHAPAKDRSHRERIGRALCQEAPVHRWSVSPSAENWSPAKPRAGGADDLAAPSPADSVTRTASKNPGRTRRHAARQ